MSRLFPAFFFAFTIGAAPGVQDPQATPSLTVTVDWLAQHLQDLDLVLLHVGEPQEYEAAHLPGAQYLARQAISTPAGSFPVLEMPPVSQLQDAFEKLGISDDSRIVVYFGKDWVTPAARVI